MLEYSTSIGKWNLFGNKIIRKWNFQVNINNA